MSEQQNQTQKPFSFQFNTKFDEIQKRLLMEVADLHAVPEGAYNIRSNSQMAGRRSTANIEITSKTDVSGMDIRIAPFTKNESVHIPVVLTQTGLKEVVYNDFFVGEGADVLIVAGCGIDNCGNQDAEHDGVHRFYVGKNAHVKYVEKHYGSGEGAGKRILNPGTEVYQDEGSTVEMEMVQIKGVDDTVRTTTAELKAGAKLLVSTPRSWATPPAPATRSATPSSWTTAASWRCRAWKPTIWTRRWSTRPPSARSPGSSSPSS